MIVEMTCRGCHRTDVIETAEGQVAFRTVDGKNVATGFCPACAPAHTSDPGAHFIGTPVEVEVRVGADGEEELYAPDPVDGHNLLLDLPEISNEEI